MLIPLQSVHILWALILALYLSKGNCSAAPESEQMDFSFQYSSAVTENNDGINIAGPMPLNAVGITEATTRTRRSCSCQNGGVCIGGGLFCDCPVDFTGRYCQKWAGNQSCGTMSHRDFFFDFSGDCQLCQCINGTLNCDNAYTCEDLQSLQMLRNTWNNAFHSVEENLFSMLILCLPAINKVIFAT